VPDSGVAQSTTNGCIFTGEFVEWLVNGTPLEAAYPSEEDECPSVCPAAYYGLELESVNGLVKFIDLIDRFRSEKACSCLADTVNDQKCSALDNLIAEAEYTCASHIARMQEQQFRASFVLETASFSELIRYGGPQVIADLHCELVSFSAPALDFLKVVLAKMHARANDDVRSHVGNVIEYYRPFVEGARCAAEKLTIESQSRDDVQKVMQMRRQKYEEIYLAIYAKGLFNLQ
jgi:hypothetical protein